MPLPNIALTLTPALAAARSSKHGHHSRGGQRGQQKRTLPPTTEQRVEWARLRLEDAVAKLAQADRDHDPTTIFVASILGRYAELLDLRALLSQERSERAESRRGA